MKTVRTILCILALLCGTAKAAKHAVTLTLDVENKECEVVGLPGIREVIDVRLTNTLTYGASDLTLAIIGKMNGTNALMAIATNFVTNATASYFSDDLNLNTVSLIAAFNKLADQVAKPFTVVLWDTTNHDTLLNDIIEIQNNPFTVGMSVATNVTPIGNVQYAPLTNGVTNGDAHDHLNGDGGTIAHSSLSGIGTRTHAALDTAVDSLNTATGLFLKVTAGGVLMNPAQGTTLSATGHVVKVATATQSASPTTLAQVQAMTNVLTIAHDADVTALLASNLADRAYALSVTVGATNLLGSAAFEDTNVFATAAQGTLAGTALQPANTNGWVVTSHAALATSASLTNYLPLAGGAMSGALRLAETGGGDALGAYFTNVATYAGLFRNSGETFFGRLAGPGSARAGLAVPSSGSAALAGNLNAGGYVVSNLAAQTYGATTWNGSTIAASQDGVRDIIETLATSSELDAVSNNVLTYVSGHFVPNGSDSSITGHVTLADSVYRSTFIPVWAMTTNSTTTGTVSFAFSDGLDGRVVTVPATTEAAFEWMWMLPSDYKGTGNIYLYVHWAPTDMSAGNVVWRQELMGCNVGGVSVSLSSASATAAAGGTAYTHMRTLIDSDPTAALTENATLYGNVYRYGSTGTDTYPSATQFLGVEIVYECDEIGDDTAN